MCRIAVVTVLVALLFCEFLIYYVTLYACDYPPLEGDQDGQLKAMILADTHLLGSRNGHWLDKLRREWQMHRAFQTAITYFRPDVVFFLGDLFDEGKWCPPEEFAAYVERFRRLFAVDPTVTKVGVVAGNHDIGFHYAVTPYLDQRFRAAFRTRSVRRVRVKNVTFVLINSVAFEGDGCFLCAEASEALVKIEKELCNGTRSGAGAAIGGGGEEEEEEECERPVLLTHYPLFRESDEFCNELDEAPSEEKYTRFREKWDCLSREATESIVSRLRPSIVFSGHTHHGCRTHHETFTEWTVASFSWRNKAGPSFLLARLGDTRHHNKQHHTVSKCFMPEENNVYLAYMIFAAVPLLSVFRLKKR